MPELGLQNQKQLTPAGYRGRDVSPSDSLICSGGSNNFSLFSSASASVERRSSASDVHDRGSLSSSDISALLSGHGFREGLRGPDSDLSHSTLHKISHLTKKVEKAKAQKAFLDAEETEDENQALDSARSSFSQALKECQYRKTRSEIKLKMSDRRRPASLDLNPHMINITSFSPRLGIKMKSSASSRKTSTVPSPGTPNYRPTSIGVQKGMSSEGVSMQTNANRRHVATALLPYNNNGRTIPSKWEDAERWILSPVSGDGAMRPSFPQPPKSKSGPLGPPGTANYNMYSPAFPMYEGRKARNSVAAPPFSAGVITAESLSTRYPDVQRGGGNFPLLNEPCMGRSVSLHGCSELQNQLSLLGFQDEKLDGVMDTATDISRDVSRRDMATQMSPEGSTYSSPRGRPSSSMSNSIVSFGELQGVHSSKGEVRDVQVDDPEGSTYSSPRGRPSSSLSNSIVPFGELQGVHSSKGEVRDVQVDDQVTMSRWSKNNRGRTPGRGSKLVDDWKRKAMEVRSASWGVSETTKSLSKIKREEAKITAWENLQKAKAEESIRKLEMKLEKKRSSSMDKIMNKLRLAQRKAQDMRGSVLEDQSPQAARTSDKALSLRTTRQTGSLSGCFTCKAF